MRPGRYGQWVDRTQVDPEIMGGVPCVVGARIPVVSILGSSVRHRPAEVLAHYTQLVIDDVLACFRYTVLAAPRSASSPPGTYCSPAVLSTLIHS